MITPFITITGDEGKQVVVNALAIRIVHVEKDRLQIEFAPDHIVNLFGPNREVFLAEIGKVPA